MVHAEGYDPIQYHDRAPRAGRQDRTRTFMRFAAEIVEREATHRAICHAELIGIPIMIVHVSGREAMEQIRWARRRACKIYAETCPQYITLTADDMKGLNMDMTGAKYVCSPAAARQGEPGGDLGGPPQRRVPDLLVRPLPVSL